MVSFSGVCSEKLLGNCHESSKLWGTMQMTILGTRRVRETGRGVTSAARMTRVDEVEPCQPSAPSLPVPPKHTFSRSKAD